ncbi:MAG TPA: hypothetical protein VIK78_03995 [Ruminiclostridium sp.]
MLKRLFLGIIILSALASEGGAYYSADLIDYYLVNLAHLDMIQDSRNAITILNTQNLDSLDKSGIPVAFFKLVSQDAINSNNSKRVSRLGLFAMSSIAIVLAIFIVIYFSLNNQISFVTRRALLSLTDSSPPASC